LCHPFESGGRALGEVDGAVSSYLNGSDASAVLPAWSRQVPLTVAAPLSGPPYVCGAEHDSSPEVPSFPAKSTVSSRLYHPFTSAVREGDADVFGAVLSTLKGFSIVLVPPSLVAEHVRVTPVVSAANVRVSQPLVLRMIDSGSVMLQLTVVLVTYHPFVPSVPLITGVTTGGVGSPGTLGSPGALDVSIRAPEPSSRRAASRRIV
jgi:hypothetical protein